MQWIGPEALDDIASVARVSNTYPEWISAYLDLAESTRSDGRTFAAAYYDRSNHCQIGNIGLALRTILAWLETVQAVSPVKSAQSARGG